MSIINTMPSPSVAPVNAESPDSIHTTSRPRISAIVLTYNEAARLPACLQSLIWADEIVVVDGFSTDDTLNVARSFTSLIYRSDLLSPEKPGGFSDQRNFAMTKATGDWILYIDADERVTPELAAEIRNVISANNSTGPVAYRMRRIEYIFGVATEFSHGPAWQTRLIRRNAGQWNGRAVHESLQFAGEPGELQGMLEHFCKNTIEHYVQTMNRYTSLEALEAFKKNPLPPRSPIPGIVKNFLHRYVYMESYREGTFGLLISLMFAFYNFLTWAKHWELAKNAGHVSGNTRPSRPTAIFCRMFYAAWKSFSSSKQGMNRIRKSGCDT